jgi:tripartite-type tricarboxylate transporter receptor subunit TctC
LPDVPAIGESLKGFEADSWFGLMVPVGTPRDVIAKLNSDVQKALSQLEVKERLLSVGGFATPGGPAELAARVKEDVAKWGKVVRTAGVKVE